MAAGSTYTPIATQTLSSAASSVTFSSLGSYTDLVLIINPKAVSSFNNMDISFNGDTSSLYSRTALSGDGSSATSARNSGLGFIRLTAAGIVASAFDSNFIVNIQNYKNTTTFKTVLARSNNGTYGVDAIVGLYRSTNAITSLTLTLTASDFAIGSSFTLYGISAA